MSVPRIQVSETRDRHRLESCLRRDAIWGGYALGDLDEPHFQRTRWFAARRESDDPHDMGLVMSYAFGGTMTLMTFGNGACVEEALARALSHATTPIHLHAPIEHVVQVARFFSWPVDPPTTYLRLGVHRETFRPAEPEHRTRRLLVRRLEIDDVELARQLYHHYPSNFFLPDRLRESAYLGVFESTTDHMIAVGGTHVSSRNRRVAALGDIVVSPEWRGQGIGTLLTSRLCEWHLKESIDLVVLNVAESNAPARASYAKLGFAHAIPHIEAFDLHLRSA